MHVDNSLQALFNPGEAENFFQIDGLPAINPAGTRSYDPINALWLSEFSRLIYRQEKDEIPTRDQNFRTRSSFLAEKGWREDSFFNKGDGLTVSTQASILSHPQLKVVVLVFRGTLEPTNVVTDILIKPEDWEGVGKVHTGFRNALQVVWELIKEALAEVRFPVFFAGHSLGAALATLSASRCLHDNGPVKPAALYTFGSPRVGDAVFAESLKALSHSRIVDQADIVPDLPPELNIPPYKHTGTLHHILQANAPTSTFADNAQVLLHLGAELRKLRNATGKIDVEPPKFLADHAPVNYTARLEEETKKFLVLKA
jgi:hypothetical protein